MIATMCHWLFRHIKVQPIIINNYYVSKANHFDLLVWFLVSYGVVSFSVGESVPTDEQMTNAKDNRNSQVFESLALLAPSQPAVSDKERKKFEDEKSKLYTQLDEKVRKIMIVFKKFHDLEMCLSKETNKVNIKIAINNKG